MKRLVLLVLPLCVALLAACGNQSPPDDATAPIVTLLSAETSANATYTLMGSATDDEGVTRLSYTLGGGVSHDITIANPFSIDLTLAAGDNVIVVTAWNETGGSGSDTITVHYDAPPSGLTVSRSQVMPGDALVLSGTAFGTSPTVSVGGANAAVTSASDSSVEILVPEDVWGYPLIVLNTLHGEAVLTDAMFVGTDFAGDVDGDSDTDGDDLQSALDALPEGGALRLGAGTVTPGTAALVVDNRSLYGADAKAGDASDSVIEGSVDFYVRGDNTVTLENVRFHGDSFDFYSGRVNRSGLSLQADGLAGRFVARGAVFEEATTGAGRFSNEAYVAGMTLFDTRIAMDGISADYTAGMTVDASNIAADEIDLIMDLNGNLTITNSTLTATDDIYLEVYEAGDGLIANSTLEAENAIDVEEDYSGTFTITDSHLLTHDGYVDVYLYSGPLTITGSTLEARADADTADTGTPPYISLYSDQAGLILENNRMIQADAFIDIEGGGYVPTGLSAVAPGDVRVQGNDEIRAGTYFRIHASGDLVVSDNGMIAAAAEYGQIDADGDLSVTGNDISVTNGFLSVFTDVLDVATSADVVFTGNTVTSTASTVYAGPSYGVQVYSAYGELLVSGNDFDVSSASSSSAPTLDVTGTMTGTAGSCTISDNDALVAGFDTAVASGATFSCSDVDASGANAFTVTNNTVKVTGSDLSTIIVDLVGHNGGTVNRSGNTFLTPIPSGLVINE